MKRIVLGLLLIGSLSAASAMTGSTACKPEKIDTVSYITGQQIAHSIEDQVMPQLKLDYSTIVSTIDKLFAKDKSITVEGVKISPDNMNELFNRYFTNELQQKVMAAMNDSTAEVFSPKDRKIVSAMIGADFAYNLKKAPYPVEKKSLLKALKDTHNGNEALTLEQANSYMSNYFAVVIPNRNKDASEKWLAKIEKQKGVKKTASGLLYRIENAGDMSIRANSDNDVVKVLYTGRTKDGKVFDSNRWADMSEARKSMPGSTTGKDSPIEFPLNRVIKGWTEGMKLIGKGGRITLWIPAELAYGERGAGNDIGANEALCFDVELLEVTDK